MWQAYATAGDFTKQKLTERIIEHVVEGQQILACSTFCQDPPLLSVLHQVCFAAILRLIVLRQYYPTDFYVEFLGMKKHNCRMSIVDITRAFTFSFTSRGEYGYSDEKIKIQKGLIVLSYVCNFREKQT